MESGESGLKWRGWVGEFMDGFDNVFYVVVGDPGAGWEADAGFVEFFGDSVCVGWGIFVDRLEVHGFPEGTGFDTVLVEFHTESFGVEVLLEEDGRKPEIAIESLIAGGPLIPHGP